MRQPCPHCDSFDTIKKAKRKNVQRFWCKNPACHKNFSVPYSEIITEDETAKERSKFYEDGNGAVVVLYTLEVPKTLDDLLRICKVDTKVWKVDKYKVNSWTTSMKSGDPGKVICTPNYQVTAWLIRKIPVKSEWPVIKPVRVAKPITRANTGEYCKKLKKALIVPDAQIGYRRDIISGRLDPFHDRSCLNVLTILAKEVSFDIIIFLGDLLDLPNWTDKFLRSPDFYFTTQPALEELHWWLQGFAKLCPEIHYIEGNHEARLEKAIIRNTIEAYGLRPANHPNAPGAMSIEGLLGLEELGIKYHGDYPNGEVWINDNLRASHWDVARKGSGDSAKAVLRDARNSEIGGHTHRLEIVHKTTHPKKGPVTYMAASCGTVARIDGVVPAKGGRHNWQQGFAAVDFNDDGFYQTQLYSINQGRVLFGGKIYDGNKDIKKIVDEISNSTGWDYR